MKRLLIAAGLTLATITGGAFAVSPIGAEPPRTAGSVVKIKVGTSHGSGTHIGNGYIITAAHVAVLITEAKPAIVVSDWGDVRDAEVLWLNERYDIALLRVRPDRLAISVLDCRTPGPGEAVYASGNPLELEFVTYWGHVSGPTREWWKIAEALPIDVTIGPGMSGGGLFAANGRLVGVVVAGYKGMPINVAVPASTVCKLLGRPL